MSNMRSKILGMLVGGAIGDALGMAVETWTPEKILEVHPEGITKYVEPIGHKWFTPETMPAGITTDDTQLTIATMKGLIAGKAKADETGSFDAYLDAIAAAHAVAMTESTAGWGKSTKEACRRIANGVHWSKSGITNEPHRGTGNGIPMKCSPMAAWYATEGQNFEKDNGKPFRFNQRLIDYTAMTHYNQLSGHACVMHTGAVYHCLWQTPEKFDQYWFADGFDATFDWDCTGSAITDDTEYEMELLEPNEDLMRTQALKLIKHGKELPTMTRDQIAELFGDGSCYVYTSLPFSYAFFLKNPHSMGTIREVVEAGGDTDTNAKMAGELIGALHGLEFFQTPENKWAIEGLKGYAELVTLGNQFCDTFGVPQ